MFVLRPARRSDLDALCELAEHLDSPNLPCDRPFLDPRLERSERAFAHGGPPTIEREYQFVLCDAAGAVVGTSAILAKHGTPGMPHVYLRVAQESRQASRVNIQVKHLTLQLGSTED